MLIFAKIPNGNAVIIITLLGVLLGGPKLRAQQADVADDVTFDDRFFIDGQIAPTFTRPEVIELFSTPSRPGEQLSTSNDTATDYTYQTGPLGQIIFAEPKGPAKVLKDLLNTPVKELLVSRAEAGPEVPEAGASTVSQAGNATPGPASVLARAADPISERPTDADVASMTAPTTAQSIREGAVPPQDKADAQSEAADTPREVAAAPPPQLEPERVEVRPERAASRPEKAATSTRPMNAHESSSQSPGRRSSSAQVRSTQPLREGRRIGTGRAAWYQHPGRTASGETFNPNQRTAAHRTLPFGTKVRVVNERTGRSVVVRINDRIPRKAKIMIDLSRASARVIGLSGTGRVSLYQLRATVVPSAEEHAQKSAAARKRTATKNAYFAPGPHPRSHLARANNERGAETPVLRRSRDRVKTALRATRTRSSALQSKRSSHAPAGRAVRSVAPAVSRVRSYEAPIATLHLPESLKPTIAR